MGVTKKDDDTKRWTNKKEEEKVQCNAEKKQNLLLSFHG